MKKGTKISIENQEKMRGELKELIDNAVKTQTPAHTFKERRNYWKMFTNFCKKVVKGIYHFLVEAVSLIAIATIFYQAIALVWDVHNFVHIKLILTSIIVIIAVSLVVYLVEGDN